MLDIMLQSLGATVVIGGFCQWSDGRVVLLLVGEMWVKCAEKKEGRTRSAEMLSLSHDADVLSKRSVS